MKITCDVKALIAGLKKVQPALKGKTTLPILSSILLEVMADSEVGDRGLILRATDLGIDVTCMVPPATSPDLFDYPLEPGRVCVPGQLLAGITSDMKSEHVSIAHDDHAGKVVVSRPDKSAIYSLESCPAEEFPSGHNHGQPEEVTIAENILQAAISRALKHVAVGDSSRYAMLGVQMTVNDCQSLTLRATNGRHLYRESIPILSCNLRPEKRSAREVLRWNCHGDMLGKSLPSMSGAVRILVDGSRVGFASGGGSTSMALLEGAFPDMDRVIPVSPPFTFRADREPLQSAVHRAIRCAKEDQSPNLLILEFFSDRLTITSNTPGIGSAVEHLTGEWRGPEGFQVGMNGVYLLRCLEVYEGQGVILGGSSTVGAWSVSSGSLEEDRIAALSPVRLQSTFQEGVDNGEG